MVGKVFELVDRAIAGVVCACSWKVGSGRSDIRFYHWWVVRCGHLCLHSNLKHSQIFAFFSLGEEEIIQERSIPCKNFVSEASVVSKNCINLCSDRRTLSVCEVVRAVDSIVKLSNLGVNLLLNWIDNCVTA